MASFFNGRLKSPIFKYVVFSMLIQCSFAVVSLNVSGLKASVSNGDVKIVFKSNAMVSSVVVNGTNIAASGKAKTFYLDWTASSEVHFSPHTLTVVENTTSRAHFYWTQPGRPGVFHIELHYVMVDGVSGIYSWAKYRNDQSDQVTLQETRTVYRFNPSIITKATNSIRNGTLYKYGYLKKQKKIQDETYQLPDGTYYSKYDYAVYIRETPYQGVYGHGYGAFLISASREYHAGDPLKQDLTVHQDSLVANYFASRHFGTAGCTAPPGWTHIYGPWLVYFNTGSDSQIIADVTNRAQIERNSWPYDFVADSDYPTSRGSVTGTVTGQPRATVFLYDSSEEFHQQSLGYLFNTETNSVGLFNISNIRPGTYNVVAYPIAGQGSENIANTTVTVLAGENVNVGPLNLPEPANIIWSIGVANRRSNEFKYSQELRNYVYNTLPPNNLTFTIGYSDQLNDWYYAQTKAGVWTIKYEDVQDGNDRTLRVALASTSSNPHLIMSLNGYKIGEVSFENDNSIYRSAMQSGTFHSNVFLVNASDIKSGTNKLTLELSKGQIMYDAISLQRNSH